MIGGEMNKKYAILIITILILTTIACEVSLGGGNEPSEEDISFELTRTSLSKPRLPSPNSQNRNPRLPMMQMTTRQRRPQIATMMMKMMIKMMMKLPAFPAAGPGMKASPMAPFSIPAIISSRPGPCATPAPATGRRIPAWSLKKAISLMGRIR